MKLATVAIELARKLASYIIFIHIAIPANYSYALMDLMVHVVKLLCMHMHGHSYITNSRIIFMMSVKVYFDHYAITHAANILFIQLRLL